jgi:hypothetical protein
VDKSLLVGKRGLWKLSGKIGIDTGELFVDMSKSKLDDTTAA